jgi:hypothetical protein
MSVRHLAPVTFDSKMMAERWLHKEKGPHRALRRQRRRAVIVRTRILMIAVPGLVWVRAGEKRASQK